MCGIFGVFNCHKGQCERVEFAKDAVAKLRHRGPDCEGMEYGGGGSSSLGKNVVNYTIAHTRLSIVDVESGQQPIVTRNMILSANGEIYNWKELVAGLAGDYPCKTNSDCEIILHLLAANYEQKLLIEDDVFQDRVARDICSLNGDFAFIAYNVLLGEYPIVARDRIGVIPLYYGIDPILENESDYERVRHMGDKQALPEIAFASEMKVLLAEYHMVKAFPPGYFFTGEFWNYRPIFRPYATVMNLSDDRLPIALADRQQGLKRGLIHSVKKRLMADVPFGVFLSGGLDSSLIAAIAARETCQKYGKEYKLKTFSISLEGGKSTDEPAAKAVAEWIGSDHYHFTFTLDEALAELPNLIYSLETFDVTTIRASMPMYLLSRRVANMGIKMVLSGEGSDELFGGYLYFHNAPSTQAFMEERQERVQNLHLSDCLRANKSSMAWGLEVRVPFLDPNFVHMSMSLQAGDLQINAENKRIEKWFLREAFFNLDKPEGDYLPTELLFRQKEQFSDGVGYGWIDFLKQHAEKTIASDPPKYDAMRHYLQKHPYSYNANELTPELLVYVNIFQSKFPQKNSHRTIARWIPKWIDSVDPSGRAATAHNNR